MAIPSNPRGGPSAEPPLHRVGKVAADAPMAVTYFGAFAASIYSTLSMNRRIAFELQTGSNSAPGSSTDAT
ncbi:MAG: hypothetical protein FWD57_10530 [Polyangiaceae bacterium]|nr:hypothetical protein [Polyangiaceae bacterium]